MVSPRKLLKMPFTSLSVLPFIPIWTEPRRSRPLPKTPISRFRGLSIRRPPSSFLKSLLAIEQQSSFTEVSGLKFSILNNSTSLPRPHHPWSMPRKKVRMSARSVANATWRNSRLTGWGIPSLLCHSHTVRICEQTNFAAEDGQYAHGLGYFFLDQRMVFIIHVCITH